MLHRIGEILAQYGLIPRGRCIRLQLVDQFFQIFDPFFQGLDLVVGHLVLGKGAKLAGSQKDIIGISGKSNFVFQGARRIRDHQAF